VADEEEEEEEEEDEEDVKEPRLPTPDVIGATAVAAMGSPLGDAEGTGTAGASGGGGGGGWKAAAAAATTPTTGDCESGRRDRRCDNDVAVVVAASERFTTPSSSGLWSISATKRQKSPALHSINVNAQDQVQHRANTV
jgi:hypothetical protein